jgi:hypothetical protein
MMIVVMLTFDVPDEGMEIGYLVITKKKSLVCPSPDNEVYCDALLKCGLCLHHAAPALGAPVHDNADHALA